MRKITLLFLLFTVKLSAQIFVSDNGTSGQQLQFDNKYNTSWKDTLKITSPLIQSGVTVSIDTSGGAGSIATTYDLSQYGGAITSVDGDAGTGISIAGLPITTSGTFTVTNTSPDQTVVLNGGTGISITGTYPTFTVNSTVVSENLGNTNLTQNEGARTYSMSGIQELSFNNSGTGSVNINSAMQIMGDLGVVGTTNLDRTVVFRDLSGANQYGKFLGTTGQWALGDGTVVTSSVVAINSTDKGFLPPRMTTAQKNAISTPATGLMVYDTDLSAINTYDGAAWAGGGGSNMANDNLTMDDTYTVTAGGRAWTLDSAAFIVRGVYDNKSTPSADVDFLTRLKTADNTTVFGVAAYNGYTDITTKTGVYMYDAITLGLANVTFTANAGYFEIAPTAGGSNGLKLSGNTYVTGDHLGVGSAFWGATTASLMVRGAGSTSGTSTALFENSSGTDILDIQDDVTIGIGTPAVSTSFITIEAGTTGKSQINLESSTAPTSPVDGDIWFDGTNILIRVSGTTYTLTKT